MIEIVPFEERHADEWDDLVTTHSANGTVFHTRRFLRYHQQDAFGDHSSMIYAGGKLVAVVAAALTDNGNFFSHPGTSCGGPVLHRDHFKIAEIVKILQIIEQHYKFRLGMRLCEWFLTPISNTPILYYFSRSCNVQFELSFFKKLTNEPLVDTIRSRRTRTAVRSIFRDHDCFRVAETDEDYLRFHSVLRDNLRRHHVVPLHTEDDFLYLKQLLGEDQSLMLCLGEDGAIQGGVWMIKASSKTWHAQYIAKHSKCTMTGLVEAILVKSMEKALANGAKIFSLGITTEHNGARLNLGLSSFKEKLGCEFGNRYILTPRG